MIELTSHGRLYAVRIVTIIDAVAVIAVATALGFACGASVKPMPALPAVGTAHDDGSGLLARASSDDTIVSLMKHGFTGLESQPVDDSEVHGVLFVAQYGGYQFDMNKLIWRHQLQRGYPSGYYAVNAATHGAVEGRVVWPKPPRAPSVLPSKPDCGEDIPNNTLRVDRRARVSGAVVYLQDIYRGRTGIMDSALQDESVQLGGSLLLEGCQFTPYVQIVEPPGSTLRLIGKPRASSQWTLDTGGTDPLTLSLGPASKRDVGLQRAGTVHVHDGHDAHAWVVVASHPYHTLSDDRGAFRLDQIPPGTYTLVVWHPPVARQDATGRISYTKPTEYQKSVTVKARNTTRIILTLPSRQ